VLYNRISAQDCQDSQDDILAMSGMAEDIRDALLDYQVGNGGTYPDLGSLKSERFNRGPNNGLYMTITAGWL
jgi:hypothetical protein